jgi:hypothetical protein
MNTIKQILTTNENIVIVDGENKMYIMGDNNNKKTGFFKKETALYHPKFTNVILDEDESIKKIYSTYHHIYVYTTKNKVYLSNYLSANKKSSNRGHRNNEIDWDAIHQNDRTDWDAVERSGFLTGAAIRPVDSIINNGNTIQIGDIPVELNSPLVNQEAQSQQSSLLIPDDSLVGQEISRSISSSPASRSMRNQLVEEDTSADEEIVVNNDNDSEYSNDEQNDEQNDETESDDEHVTGYSDRSIDTEDAIELERRVLSDLMNHAHGQLTPGMVYTLNFSNTQQHSVPSNQQSSINMNNRSFLNSLKNKHQDSSSGFSLFQSDITDLTVSAEALFFLQNGKLHVYTPTVDATDMFHYKTFGLNFLQIKNDQYPYYQVVFPFEVEKFEFRLECVYFCASTPIKYHHFFSAEFRNDAYDFNWIYFKTDIEFDSSDIYFCVTDLAAFIIKDTIVYKYCYQTQNLEKFIDDPESKNKFLNVNDGSDILLMSISKKNGVSYGACQMIKDIEYNPLCDDIIDYNHNGSRGHCFILIKTDNSTRYSIHKNDLYFNVGDLKYYKLLNSGLVYYDNTNTLYYCTNQVLNQSTYNTTEIEKINMPNGMSYYIYMFNGTPNPIDNVTFSHNIILIQSENRYYYHVIGNSNFKVDTFTEILLTEENIGINKNQIFRQANHHNDSLELTIGTSTNKFKKMLTIVELLRNRTDIGFDITLTDGEKEVAIGDGPKREFMESAANQFSEKYLIKYNVVTEFNIDAMKKFTDDELFCIGYMLHTIMCESKNPLSIRLPISLLSALKGKQSIKIKELEFFAEQEDPVTFKNANMYCNDPDGFASLETDYNSYEDYIKYMCKYDYQNSEIKDKIKHISEKIADGFVSCKKIKNLGIMNYPTLDYYLSGELKVNRALLIKNLKIVNNTESKIDYTKIVSDFIEKMDENKLLILLKNWSGTTIVKKSETYTIVIQNESSTSKRDIIFHTCSLQIDISGNLIDNPETAHLMLDLLTTPMNTMEDV